MGRSLYGLQILKQSNVICHFRRNGSRCSLPADSGRRSSCGRCPHISGGIGRGGQITLLRTSHPDLTPKAPWRVREYVPLLTKPPNSLTPVKLGSGLEPEDVDSSRRRRHAACLGDCSSTGLHLCYLPASLSHPHCFLLKGLGYSSTLSSSHSHHKPLLTGRRLRGMRLPNPNQQNQALGTGPLKGGGKDTRGKSLEWGYTCRLSDPGEGVSARTGA